LGYNQGIVGVMKRQNYFCKLDDSSPIGTYNLRWGKREKIRKPR
jgi:hypothetical protein